MDLACLLSLRLLPIIGWILHRHVFLELNLLSIFMLVFCIVLSFYFPVLMWLQFTLMGSTIWVTLYTTATSKNIPMESMCFLVLFHGPYRCSLSSYSSIASSWGCCKQLFHNVQSIWWNIPLLELSRVTKSLHLS